jgi:hypothetical protein
VEGIVSSAVAQANAIIQGAENTVAGIASDVTNAVVSGLQLIFGTVTSVGKGVLDAISDGAGAITDILIELQNNLTTTFINFFQPVKDMFLFYGNTIVDVLSAVQSAFGPVEALVNATVLLACCIAQAIQQFPGGPSFTLPGGCATNDCGCLCRACDDACGDSGASCGNDCNQTCTCASRGSHPCCPSLF